jgi:1-deoxy-D-xylulose-5-phosphate reductoisomerase
VLNAANETAVAAFLAGNLTFREIVPLVQGVLENHHFDPNPTLGQILAADGWARQEALRWVCA